MSVQDELQSMSSYITGAWNSLIARGATVPTNKNLINMIEAIENLPKGPGYNPPEPPVLDEPLTAEQLLALQDTVKEGKASEHYSIGQTLLINFDNSIMPFEIVGFEDVEVEGGATHHAINLLSKYAYGSSAFATTSDVSLSYPESVLRTYITTTYQNKLDTNFVNCLANTKYSCYQRDNTTEVLYDKLFAPSCMNLGITEADGYTTSQAQVEGPTFTAFVGAPNSARVRNKFLATGTADYYYTRSLGLKRKNYVNFIMPSGDSDYDGSYEENAVVVSCNFIGGE